MKKSSNNMKITQVAIIREVLKKKLVFFNSMTPIKVHV
jgi:hypothetical protein